MTAQSLGQTRPGDPRLSRGTSSYTELARRVRASGLLHRRLGYYWLSFGAAVLALAIVAAAVVRVGDSWWQLALAAALGVVLTQFGFLGHDAAHRQIFRSARWNEAAARVLSGAFTGLSYAWWKGKHDRHHAAPNQEGRDPDIAPGALVFTRGAAESRTGTVSRWALRRQGWLFFPLLTLEGVALHLASLRRLTAPGTVGRWPEMTLILTRLTSYVAVMFLLLPPLKAAMFVAVQLAVFGLCLGGSFAPNHKGMPIVPHTARIDFLRRQVLMSRNIRGGPVVDVLMGGLNYQIEHHLFPSMPRPNLKRVQPMVREYCQEIDVPYAELGLLASYAVVVSYLNDVGLRARDPFDCPLVADLRTGLPTASGRARS